LVPKTTLISSTNKEKEIRPKKCSEKENSRK
jgi:hypothetical protein